MRYTMDLSQYQRDALRGLLNNVIGLTDVELEPDIPIPLKETEAYKQGYEEGKLQRVPAKERLNKAMQEGYDSGYKAGYDEGIQRSMENDSVVYSKGLKEAWELAGRILNEDQELYNLIMASGGSLFDRDIKWVKAQVKAYDERIKVGDEVYLIDKNHPLIVTANDGDNVVCLARSGKYSYYSTEYAKNNLHKTDRNVSDKLNSLWEDEND